MRWSIFLPLCIACGDPAAPTDAGSTDADAATDAATDVASTDTTDADADAAIGVRACIAEAWVRRTCTGCHFGSNHLDLRFDALETLLTTNRELFPSEPLVVPNDPDGSILIRKLEAKLGLIELEEDEGDPMPPDLPITEDAVQTMRDWVATGAVLPERC